MSLEPSVPARTRSPSVAMRHFICALSLWFIALSPAVADEPLKLLFLGDNGHHRPAERFLQLDPVLMERGIHLEYVDVPEKVLTDDNLAGYDGVVLYANIDRIEPANADALLKFVENGGGFIPLHCATYCFRNDERIVALMGGQFKRHGGEVFSTVIAEPTHPIMQGFGGFTSWDETYVHTLHNPKDRTVLEYRVQGTQDEGQDREPWTWVRTHGQGRVFYTAWGHDERTWGNPGFQNLVERGIRWACGDDPAKAGPFHEAGRESRAPFVPLPMTAKRTDVQPFEYVEVGAKIPHYVNSDKWGMQAEPYTKMQLPLSPEESLKHYVVPQGFELRLFACESSVQSPVSSAESGSQPTLDTGHSTLDRPYAGLGGKPIAMNWDERGRLWVCETLDYPNELKAENKGRDRIRVCEDTDGNGQADKFTIFAEGLSIPTTLLPVYGGLLVQNGTETLFLKDTDGDDVADVREVLITGWAMNDTHGGVSNFRYGLDNWIYAMQGYNDSQPVIAATGEKGPRFRQGFWRMKLASPKESSVQSPVSSDVSTQPSTLNTGHAPQVLEIEFLRSTNNNTWGLGISEEGLIFGSTANRNPSEFMPIPNRYYERVLGWGPSQLNGIADTYLFKAITDTIRQVDQFGGYTAGCGHALYTARNYPEQYWNRTAFVCEPTGHLVGTFVLTPDGAGFKSHSPCNLIASDDEWAAPIMAEVGPDGNVWILDWYNYIIQHNPTPIGFQTGKGNAYESELRDKKHGRVYRLVYTGAKSGDGVAGTTPTSDDPRGPDLSKSTPDDLVSALKHPTMAVRLQAQRLIGERLFDCAPELLKLAQDQSVDAANLNPSVIHALWTLKALSSSAPTVEISNQLTEEYLPRWEELVGHPSPGVRRAAMQTAPFVDETGPIIVERLNDETDAQVRLAALLAASDRPSVRKVDTTLWKMAQDSSGVMNDRWLADAINICAAVLGENFLGVPAHRRLSPPLQPADSSFWAVSRRVAEHIARGKPDSRAMEFVIFDIAQTEGQFVSTVLDGLAAGWQKGYTVELSADSERSLLELLDRAHGAEKSKVIRLGALLGAKGMENQAAAISASLLATIASTEEPVPVRRDAAAQLISFRPQDAAVVTGIVEQITPQAQPSLSRGLIDALGDSTAENVGPELVSRAAGLTPSLKEDLIRVLLKRPATTLALLDGVEAGSISLSDLKLDQKTSLSNHPDRQVRQRARRILSAGGGLPDADRQKVLETLLPIADETGDVAAGKEVFKKNCAKCHRHSGEGENIGPDLTGMAVHPKSELLVHILDPSRSVEGNFRSYTVVMNDGLTFNGMLAAESQTSIELVDTEAKKHTLVRQDIDQLIASTKSVMPEGFEKTIQRPDFVNLMEFLTAKGKWVPLDLRKVATSVSTKAMFVSDNADAERLIFENWGPKEFHGVPFLLVDPKGETTPNAVLLYGPQGKYPPQMPQSVKLPLNAKTKAIHLLSGVSGWGSPYGEQGSVSMIVRLHYADGQTEDHELKNGVHFADYIRRVDVPESEFAFPLRNQQIRYLAVEAKRQDVPVKEVELVKGPDTSAPVVMAITAETP
jgi:putative membrane-bound dehydrogenase-like protein